MGMRRGKTLRLKYEEGCRHYSYQCDIYKELYIHPVVSKSIIEQNLDFANERSCCPVRRRTLHTVMSD